MNRKFRTFNSVSFCSVEEGDDERMLIHYTSKNNDGNCDVRILAKYLILFKMVVFRLCVLKFCFVQFTLPLYCNSTSTVFTP